MRETIAQSIVQVVVNQIAPQSSLDATTVALARIDHRTTITIVACHHRQLLVTNLRVVCCKICMHRVAEEVQVSTHLIIPAGFRFVRYGIVDALVFFVCMGNVVALTVDHIAILIEFCLQDIAEHLNIIASCTIALADGCIQVAVVLVDDIVDAKLGQQLIEMITSRIHQRGGQRIGLCLTEDLSGNCHKG